jgi:hypothetical protein
MKTYSMQWLIALAASVGASAQPPQAPGDRRPPPVPPLIAVFDTDRDRVISAEEIQAASEALAKLDKDGDGEITLEEIHPPRDGKPPGGKPGKPGRPDGPPPGDHPVPPLIKALDTDADGTISTAELAGAPESLKSLDKDGDGELSPEEIRPQGPPPGRGGPPPHDGPPDDGPGVE